ncbi:MAG: hypothetical protein CL696_14015 [Chloroflexi bacterium]|nr:hypothetical protein [Chloroflexota bacterium]MQG54505.1 J domain-containing protein [SAR202 cluster bacterium]
MSGRQHQKHPYYECYRTYSHGPHFTRLVDRVDYHPASRELLQVSESVDQEIIQTAYRRLILGYHPDRSTVPNAREMNQRLNDAYAILGDPVLRADYDRELRWRTSSSSSGTGQASSRTSQNRPPPPPPPRRASEPEPTGGDSADGFPVTLMLAVVVAPFLIWAALPQP